MLKHHNSSVYKCAYQPTNRPTRSRLCCSGDERILGQFQIFYTYTDTSVCTYPPPNKLCNQSLILSVLGLVGPEGFTRQYKAIIKRTMTGTCVLSRTFVTPFSGQSKRLSNSHIVHWCVGWS